MVRTQLLVINSVASVAEVLVRTVLLLILVRLIVATIGVEQLGIWALVVASASVSRVADLGFSGSVVKFVANHDARKDHKAVAEVIGTAVTSVALLLAVLLVVAYLPIREILSLFIDQASLATARSLLPYSFLTIWLNLVSAVFMGGLEGQQRIYLRSLILLLASSAHLVLCYFLLPVYGVLGLAFAAVAQAGMSALLSWQVLWFRVRELPLLPFGWDHQRFREMIGYALSFQVISLAQMLYDPITKVLMSYFGSLSDVGFYEMARRVVTQLRAMLIAANRVVVPEVAALQVLGHSRIEKLYTIQLSLVTLFALPLYSLVFALAPPLSIIWVGNYAPTFIFFVGLLSLGWFINTMSTPAYLSNLGTGEMKWNCIGQLTIGLLNLLFGCLLGWVAGGLGVAVGWIGALGIGSLVVLVSYHQIHKIPMRAVLARHSIYLLISCILALNLGLAIFFYWSNQLSPFLTAGVVVAGFVLLLAGPVWRNPMSRRVLDWLGSLLPLRAE